MLATGVSRNKSGLSPACRGANPPPLFPATEAAVRKRTGIAPPTRESGSLRWKKLGSVGARAERPLRFLLAEVERGGDVGEVGDARGEAGRPPVEQRGDDSLLDCA